MRESLREGARPPTLPSITATQLLVVPKSMPMTSLPLALRKQGRHQPPATARVAPRAPERAQRGADAVARRRLARDAPKEQHGANTAGKVKQSRAEARSGPGSYITKTSRSVVVMLSSVAAMAQGG